ncbi:hypothetical protein [Ruminococcus sp. HUN007]|uniref:hypothetical protein n=1 Tax=Ruminococcus sp. HUN007 TaxID=1514668 RepID=UPI0005D2C52D|nr:hypothetical protein [Ruminococcus sp. HUN007]
MFRRNIAIALLVLMVIAVFTVAIWFILPHNNKKDNQNTGNNSSQPMMKVSDIIGEAVYMGSYSTDTEIYAEEPFAAKDTLRRALAKSSGLPDNASVMIEAHNFDDLSVVFDDGRTMRTLEQPGIGNVMIVASIPKPNGDTFYAYNVQITVKESRIPKNTESPDVTEGIVTSVGLTAAPSWEWKKDEAEETEAVTTKKIWTAPKTTTAAAKASSKPSATAKVTEAAAVPVTEAPSVNPVTEAPSPQAEPDPPSVPPSVEEPAPQPQVPEPQEPDPPQQQEPEPEPEPQPEAAAPEAAQE